MAFFFQWPSSFTLLYPSPSPWPPSPFACPKTSPHTHLPTLLLPSFYCCKFCNSQSSHHPVRLSTCRRRRTWELQQEHQAHLGRGVPGHFLHSVNQSTVALSCAPVCFMVTLTSVTASAAIICSMSLHTVWQPATQVRNQWLWQDFSQDFVTRKYNSESQEISDYLLQFSSRSRTLPFDGRQTPDFGHLTPDAMALVPPAMAAPTNEMKVFAWRRNTRREYAVLRPSVSELGGICFLCRANWV